MKNNKFKHKYPTKMPLKPLPWFLVCYNAMVLVCCCPQFKLRAQHMAWIFKGNFNVRWQYCLI